MTLLAALALGLFIGAVLGALGGGGAILTVPALVYVLGESAQGAISGSLVVVGVTAAVAAAGHARYRTVRWDIGIPFAAVGIVAAFAGTACNRRVSESVLLVGFSVLMVFATAAMLVRARQESVVLARAGSGVTTLAPALTKRQLGARIAVGGTVVGFLTGFFGVGGGWVIVPAMVLGLGLAMPVAIGTSLFVIAVNSGAGLLARAGDLTVHWVVVVPFTLAAIVGTVAGRRTAHTLPPLTLTRAFAGLLVAVALFTGIENAVRLT